MTAHKPVTEAELVEMKARYEMATLPLGHEEELQGVICRVISKHDSEYYEGATDSFMSKAYSDMPRLIAEVERLQGLVDDFEADQCKHKGTVSQMRSGRYWCCDCSEYFWDGERGES